MTTAASPSVAIVGGGLSGMTAALRLAQRGYSVTLFEKDAVLGGNVASHLEGGLLHDVYPHMLCDWYDNLWSIIEDDLGCRREELCEPRQYCLSLDPGPGDPKERYHRLYNGSSLYDDWRNLLSGSQPIPDMFLFAYSSLDLAIHQFDTSKLLDRYSVNGFLRSQPYITERAAFITDSLLMEVWSIHSENTSAESYRDFLRAGLRFSGGSPFMWLLRGPSEEMLIGPLAQRLADLGCEIRLATRVVGISPLEETVAITAGPRSGSPSKLEFDYVVLAADPKGLGVLVETAADGPRLVDLVHSLSEIRRLRTAPIPVLHLYFKKELDLPKEVVGLTGSDYRLSFLDVSQLWEDPGNSGNTVITLACSDFFAIADEPSDEFAYAMVCQLHDYLPLFEPGTGWGDEAADIDWGKSVLFPNLRNQLFLNEVGSSEWRPRRVYEELPRVFFAGDATLNPVNMATLEAAVVSGLEAAQEVWQREPLGDPIPILRDERYSDLVLEAIKMTWLPWAYGSKLWSTAIDIADEGSRSLGARALAKNASEVAATVLYGAADWWQSAASLWSRLANGDKR